MIDYYDIAASFIQKNETPHDALLAAAREIRKAQICIDTLREENKQLRNQILKSAESFVADTMEVKPLLFYPPITMK